MKMEPGQILDEHDVITAELLARYVIVDIKEEDKINSIVAICLFDSQGIDKPGSISFLDEKSILGNITIYWKLDGVRIFDES